LLRHQEQCARVPGVSEDCWRGPVARYVWDLTDRAASRWVVPFGAAGDPDDPHFADQLPVWAAGDLVPVRTGWARLTYTEDIPGFGRLRLVPVDPDRDAALMHGWVTQPRARFWGMGSYTVDEVREVYAFLDGLATHHAYLVEVAGRPVGIFQTYDPAADPVGERYPVRPGDIGLHVLLVPWPGAPRDVTGTVGAAFARYLFHDPRRQRVVVEPDVRNELALRRLRDSGFVFSDEIDLPDKRAQLAFLDRETWKLVTDRAGRTADV
jgi:penicillin amidase